MGERKLDHPDGEWRPESESTPKVRFDMGQIVITAGADITLAQIERHPVQLLARHVEGKWGNLDEHDLKENEFSLENGYRLLSAYNIEDARFYVITECDRSVTTVSLPEEY